MKRVVARILVALAALLVGLLAFLENRAPHTKQKKVDVAESSGTANDSRPGTSSAVHIPGRPQVRPRQSLDAEGVKKTYSELLSEHRRLRLDPANVGHSPRARFTDEVLFKLREGRLLALAYPDAVEVAISDTCLDSSAHAADKQYAVLLAGVLAREGRKASEELLYRMALSEEWDHQFSALRVLNEADREGRHLALYWTKARDNNFPAIIALGAHTDVSTVRVLNEVAQRAQGDGYPAGTIRGRAEESLEKITALSAPDWSTRLEKVLLGSEGQERFWVPWAIQVCETRGLPNLRDVLRRRLDSTEARILQNEGVRRPSRGDLTFEEYFATADWIGLEAGDRYFDDLLIAYTRNGGALTDHERRRLRHFGYACDPTERLAELLAGQK